MEGDEYKEKNNKNEDTYMFLIYMYPNIYEYFISYILKYGYTEKR
jgi:hypothetical protein